MNFSQFFKELKRRSIYKVAITYAVVAWLVAQIAGLGANSYGAPEWVIKMILLVLVIGFPIALIFTWAFEMSPEGIIRTTSDDVSESPLSDSKKKPSISNVIIGVLLLLLIGQWTYNRYWDERADIANIEKSIAVLPFRNMSENQANQHFCDGMMETILNHLSKIPDVRVISRTSVEQYRDDPPPIPKIGKDLGVSYIVEGSVQRIENQALITVQLINAKSDNHIWAKDYDRDLSKIFSVQAEITKLIADELQTFISPEVKRRIEAIPTSDPLAYDYWLQGNEYLYRVNYATQSNKDWTDLLGKSKLFYELALERDSSFAEAIIGLAGVDYKKNVDASILKDDYLDYVFALANKGLALNPNLSDGYLIRSMTHYRKARMELTKVDLVEALRLNPNNVAALYHQFDVYRNVDIDFTNAAETLKKIEIRVNSENDLWILYDAYFWFYLQLGDFERAEIYNIKQKSVRRGEASGSIQLYEFMGSREGVWKVINEEYHEENQFKLIFLGKYFLYGKEYEKAVPYFEKWEELVIDQSANNIFSIVDYGRYGQALMGIGEERKGIEMLEKQIEINKKRIELKQGTWISSTLYDLAGIYSYLGDRENAYFWLERFEEANGWLVHCWSDFIPNDLQFDNIRNDQRFKDMLAKAEAQQEVLRNQVRKLLPLEELKD